MKKIHADIFRIVLTPILDAVAVFFAFWLAYNLRSITDGIPFVQLRIPYISPEQFSPFVIFGVIIWLVVFFRSGLYSHIRRPIFEEIRRVLVYAFFWFFVYIGFVYLTQGFLFFKEIPRLIILYTLILGAFFSVVIRSILHIFWQKMTEKNFFPKEKILVIQNQKDEEIIFEMNFSDSEYIFMNIAEANRIENTIRKGEIRSILLTSGEFNDPKIA